MTSKQLSKYCLVVLALLLSTPAMSQFGGSGIVNTNAVQALQEMVYRADQSYASGDYKTAFKLYERLAQDAGDNFSQYRLAYMYLHGQHVEQDPVKAYAWSSLAAETGTDQFQQFHRQVASGIDSETLTRAEVFTKDLRAKFGVFQQAYQTRKLIRAEKFSCTGSRVGNTCASVSSQSLSCAAGADQAPSETCLRMGRMGLNAVAGSFPLQVKEAEQLLEGLMRTYNPGQVTLGELELIDDGEDQMNGAGENQQSRPDEDDD